MIKNYDEIIKKKRSRYNYMCEVCGKDTRVYGEELAHRIHNYKGKKTKRPEYQILKEIINHPFNLAYTCHACNQKVLIDNKPVKKDLIIKLIKTDLKVQKLLKEKSCIIDQE